MGGNHRLRRRTSRISSALRRVSPKRPPLPFAAVGSVPRSPEVVVATVEVAAVVVTAVEVAAAEDAAVEVVVVVAAVGTRTVVVYRTGFVHQRRMMIDYRASSVTCLGLPYAQLVDGQVCSYDQEYH